MSTLIELEVAGGSLIYSIMYIVETSIMYVVETIFVTL